MKHTNNIDTEQPPSRVRELFQDIGMSLDADVCGQDKNSNKKKK